MNKAKIIGLIRHVLTFGGGYLVAKGIASDALVVEISAAIVTAIGGVWSILDKK